ncbi:MAG TPA: formylglycine-generating enzyme family protein [Planctomycetaceae bacterium]|nr:formylglycine-generating enzyme family protein [Planctomycetaceae bacterium]
MNTNSPNFTGILPLRRLIVDSVVALAAVWAIGANQTVADELELLKQFHSEWVAIERGSFEMGRQDGDGSELPVHTVQIDYSFMAARYEVTQNLYEAVMGVNPSRWTGPRNSVEMVSHNDAVVFCRKVTQRMQAAKLIDVKSVVRLPTEAEWEYFTRAGTKSRYSFGDDDKSLGDYAWYTSNASGNDPPVGAKKPNPWGLFDVHGYLSEWCLDRGHASYKGAPTDGSPWNRDGNEELRVLRGGSWKDKPNLLTSSVRSGSFSSLADAEGNRKVISFDGGVIGTLKDDAIGFRCVLVAIEKAYDKKVQKRE